jgi:hypothetical protein
MTNTNIVRKTNTLIEEGAPLKIIYELDYGTQIGMVKQRDGNLRCSVGIVVISPEGQISDMVHLKRSKIITGKNAFNFLYDFDDFTREDILAVQYRVMEELRKDVKHTTYSHNFISWEYMYQLIVRYATVHEVPDMLEIDKDYIYIGTDVFEQMLTDICEDNYIECKKKELLNLLLACGILKPNRNVPYLYKKKKKKKDGYDYVYRLSIIKNEIPVVEGEE